MQHMRDEAGKAVAESMFSNIGTDGMPIVNPGPSMPAISNTGSTSINPEAGLPPLRPPYIEQGAVVIS
jgi:hypothetical protein